MHPDVIKLESEEYTKEEFEKLLNESFIDETELGVNKFVSGKIVKIDNEHVSIDVGEKIEGRIKIDEITDKDGNLLYKEGDEISVLFSGVRGERPIISYKKAKKIAQQEEFIANNKDNLEGMHIVGKVVRKNRGGYIVENEDGVEFFLPKSLASFKEGIKIEGKKVEAKIIKYDKQNNSIVISRRAVLNEKRKEKRKYIKELIEEKKIITGIVKKILSYGMFVDIGKGVEGLVHYTEISYKGPVNPASMYQEGDEVEVVATNYDKKTKKLSLSIKAAHTDPWEDLSEQLDVGDMIQVVVNNIEPYGVFVDLGNEIEGFLHISELSWEKNIKHPSQIVEVGQEIDTEVIELDIENKKLRVSLKRLQPKPFESFIKNYQEGESIKGIISSITDFGAFIKIDSVEGLLHNEDASWSGKKCKELFNPDEEIEVKIVKIDKENEKISLSRKNLEDSPVKIYAKDHQVGDIVEGKVVSIKDFGVFVQLLDNIDALIRKEDLYPLKEEDIEIGMPIRAVITSIEPKRNKIRLSHKKLERQLQKEALKQVNAQDSNSTLGDILKEALK